MTVGLDAIADPAQAEVFQRCRLRGLVRDEQLQQRRLQRGVATNYGGTWNELDMTGLPNRYPGAIYIDQPADPAGGTVYLAFNGYNRRFIEGPGAGVQHVFKGVLTKGTGGAVSVKWTDISGNMPDVPATDVLRIGNKLVVGTDYGVIVPTSTRAQRVTGRGSEGLVADDHGVRPARRADGNLYAATHGRGIWRTTISAL